MNPNKILSFCLLMFLYSCVYTPRGMDYNDNELQQYWSAVNKVDRSSLGFSEIEEDSRIGLEDGTLRDKPYDRMLHIYGSTSRTIAFELLESGDLKWLGEQESIKGPMRYNTPDGECQEQIVLTYHLKPISGHRINVLNISYRGERSELIKNNNLSLEDVRPYIEQWSKPRSLNQ